MRYFCYVRYIGTTFHGWAKQDGFKTVQGEIEFVLEKILDRKIKIHASGRTDKYVHAENQAFHFDIDYEININNTFLEKINSYFKNNIEIKSIRKVSDDFHARFNIKEKIYLYKINTKKKDFFKSNEIYQYNKKINVKKMKEASKLFIGEHDFLSFSTSEKNNTNRTINSIHIKKKKGIINIYISGNGFLRNMVRMIVASLIDVSENKKTINDIKELINNPSKGSSINKAPGCGLYLYKLIY